MATAAARDHRADLVLNVPSKEKSHAGIPHSRAGVASAEHRD